jgi:hypothetical protein
MLVNKRSSVVKAFEKRETRFLLLIFIFSLLSRYYEYYHFREFNSDKARQLHGAYELLWGNGVSFKYYDLDTFQPVSQPIILWPPGYSYLTSAITFLSDLNLYTASIILDVITLAGLWFVLLWMTRLLKFNLLQTFLLFVLFGFSKSINFIYSSDLLGTVFFLFSCALTLQFIEKTKTRQSIICFLLLQFASIFVTCFLKYSLLPAGFAIGFSLLSYSFFSKKNFYKLSVWMVSFCLVSILCLFLYNQLRSGHNTGIYNRHPNDVKTFYFENILLFTPFLANGFFYLDIAAQWFNYKLVQLVSLLFTIWIFGWIIVKTAQQIKAGKVDYFSHLVLITLLLVTGFLTALSLFYPSDEHTTYSWTYVKEFRYFSPAVFLIIIYLVKKFKLSFRQKPAHLFISFFVGISAISALLLGSYYQITGNMSNSFENKYGKINRVDEFVARRKDEQTYFLSLTNNVPVDIEATSMVAIKGTKVSINYDGDFPDSTFSALYSKTHRIPKDKKLIIFLDQNEKILDSINLMNHHRIEANSYGEKFLIIEN